MNSLNLDSASARMMAQAVRELRVSPVDLLQHHLQHIEQKNDRIKALRCVAAAQARKLAKERAAEAQRGAVRGRLHGLVFCVKDHINIAGLPRSEGTSLESIECDTRTSAAAGLLLAEGAICIGKANMAEYAKSYHTSNLIFGATRNPVNAAHSPGGSGGGDAAAVAAGFAAFALGADAGGSLRVPANFCGAYALYPTGGTVSSAGLDAYTHSALSLFRSLGPICRTLDDLELLYRVLSRFDPEDPESCPRPLPAMAHPPRQRRFAWFSEMNGVPCDPEINKHLKRIVARFESAGWAAEEYLPPCFAGTFEPFVILGVQALLAIEDRLARERGQPRVLDAESPAMQGLRQRLAAELPPPSADQITEAWHTVARLRLEAAQISSSYDFVLCPVAACLPPPINAAKYPVGKELLQAEHVFQFASAPNVLGLPALAFPCGQSQSGLPVGLQLVGARFGEFELCSWLRAIADT